MDTRKTTQRAQILIVIFVLSFALDYKGEVGGSALQYAMAAVNTAAFVGLAFIYRFTFPRQGITSFVFWAWVTLLFVGSVGAIAGDVPFGRYFRTIYPFILFAEGFLVAWWSARDELGRAMLVRVMVIAALVSFVFTIWWGFSFSGKGIGTIRYEILSPLIPILFVVAGYDLFFTRRKRFRSLAILVATLGVVFLSVTRGMFLTIGMVFGALLAAWVWNIIRGGSSLPRPFYRALVWGAIGVPVIFLISMIAAPDVASRWIYRSVGPMSSTSFWTRIAAVVDQWEQLVANPVALFLGRGFGQSYHYARSYGLLAIPFISPALSLIEIWYPGEFMWMTFLYYGGLLVGTLVIIVLLWGTIRSIGVLSELLRCRAWRLANTRPIWIGVLGFFAFLGLGFTANPFIIRLSALFLGMTLGLSLTVARSLRCGRGDLL